MDIMTFTPSLSVMYPGENDFVIFMPDKLKINLPTVAIEPIAFHKGRRFDCHLGLAYRIDLE